MKVKMAEYLYWFALVWFVYRLKKSDDERADKQNGRSNKRKSALRLQKRRRSFRL